MVQVNDHTGKTFGFGTVTGRAASDGRPGVRWSLLCKCGRTYEARGIDLTSNKIRSCGCLKKDRIDDLTGRTFGRWTVVALGPPSPTGLTRWLCVCECGTRQLVHAGALKSGHTKSCGCYQDAMRSANKTRHGHSKAAKKTETYRSWETMRKRCQNPNAADYAYYGGRGITVCDRWNVFENFLADMGECPPGMTIERNNPDRGYEPKNCRWATRQEQSQNRRDTIRLTHDGVTRSLAEWSELLGIKAITIHMRLRRGCSHSEALAVNYKRKSR